MFALVDVNAFYASCETIFRPDLQGRPVVVLSNNDGCVIARSAEAKALGIAMGAPYFKIKDDLRRQNVAVFSSNYALYADMSRRVMDTLEEMAPAVEIYSLDEAFLRLDGINHCIALKQFGSQIRDRIQRELHLTVGVGIAPSKTLAKLANYAAKKWRGAQGVVDLSEPARQRKLLALIPVEEVWGIGRRLARQLQAMGIHTALQLADCDTRLVRKTFSVVLERTVRELRGGSCLPLEAAAVAREQIICSRSFGQRLTYYPHMREAICSYAECAAEKLRQDDRYCRHVSVFIKTSPHAASESYYSNMGSARLRIPSNDSRDIIATAVRVLESIWQEGRYYLKGGVMLGDFSTGAMAQLDLFDGGSPWRNSGQLMDTLDKLNREERGRIWFAGQGIAKPWQMKREMLSPAYTTRLADIPWVRLDGEIKD
ncbi:translesion error-prone DNA polymerase V subunit UmuC [Serratia symbiotica]|uniref:translesion error-prone DNA polymerase V subunit UmuC n=1 Tax=Serratia symbiotica TaxID=138074 RepID=UPI001320D051|nr:translesion error-prone DNA polymerase V subunit UmuC [Serratia symbiotica]MBF1995177.1 translesion error-prone DNA polymerase V subunit UmuC [Serratia symbiotica]MBQ0956849.1 translesion error-prone DNA polymerase V subunit UmuC [Serratia symbiotica]QTP13561.1 translesion error-prone DNA polymerase V subunit UmuC [Serratia symbiotica]